MAPVVLDALCHFLGITPFSALHRRQGTVLDGVGHLRYARGLGAANNSWTNVELCMWAGAPGIQALARGFATEYAVLPQLLTQIGVQELGVSPMFKSGGLLKHRCGHLV